MDYPTLEDLQKAIEWSIEQGGNDNYILCDNNYPYIWGYYLHNVEAGGRAVLFGGILPVTLVQTKEQLSSALSGEPIGEGSKFNIDWDIRSSISGSFLTLKKKDGSRLTMMGTFNFDTPEEGAERWLEQIKERVAKGLWVSNEEYHKRHAEINKIFQDFFDKHCADDMDCPLIPTCQVRWPTGIGLVGCRVKDEGSAIAKVIAAEAEEILKG